MLPSFNSGPVATLRAAHVVEECLMRLEHLDAKRSRVRSWFQCCAKLSSNSSTGIFAITII